MKYFERFFTEFQQDLKAFIFWCLVFTVFRIAFLCCYSGQLAETSWNDIFTALWLGFRISLKTTGIIILLGIVFATLPRVLINKWPAEKIRKTVHYLLIFFFTVCFFARIPYYKIFNSAFNMMLINGVHDDIAAILATAVDEYQLLWRLPAALITAAVICHAWSLFLKYLPGIEFTNIKCKKLVAVFTILMLPVLWVFVRFGGAFTYADSINWISAARLKSNLLNEAILDDGQALYRVYYMKRDLNKITDINISADELRQKITALGGNGNVSSIDQAFERTVKQERLSKKPTNVVLIIGESFGLWPFLEEYKDLGLVDKSIALQNSANGAAVKYMLANSTGTIGGINGIVTGLPDTGKYENYQPNPENTIYKSGVAYIMKQLGYKTIFWYGGFSSWQNIRSFILSQGFDEFHCADEFTYTGGNSWGCPDKVLFDNISKYINTQGDEKVLHVVMTGSNHPPYTIAVDKEGFARETVKTKLDDSISSSDMSLTDLGHIWYADHVMGNFIEATDKKIPDSLFVVTGDHSERFTFEKEQDIKTLSAIPCIFYGSGIEKVWFEDKIGVTMQLPGTLAELIAPAGFKYTALWPNIFNTTSVFNHRLYADDTGIGLLNSNEQVKKTADDAKSIAAWRILKGDKF